jgi:hypothetical protein
MNNARANWQWAAKKVRLNASELTRLRTTQLLHLSTHCISVNSSINPIPKASSTRIFCAKDRVRITINAQHAGTNLEVRISWSTSMKPDIDYSSIYTNLSGRQKILVGSGMFLWGAIGLAILPATEQALDLKPDPKETERLTKILPTIRAVDLDPDHSPKAK